MKNAKKQSPPIRRRTIYVDGAVQKWLLIALVTFEVILISVALWLFYLQLQSMVEVIFIEFIFPTSHKLIRC